MSSDAQLTPTPEPPTGSSEEQFRRDRRKLVTGALAGVPVIVSVMARPVWAQPAEEPGTTYTRPGAFTCHSALNAGYTEDHLKDKYGQPFLNPCKDNQAP